MKVWAPKHIPKRLNLKKIPDHGLPRQPKYVPFKSLALWAISKIALSDQFDPKAKTSQTNYEVVDSKANSKMSESEENSRSWTPTTAKIRSFQKLRFVGQK